MTDWITAAKVAGTLATVILGLWAASGYGRGDKDHDAASWVVAFVFIVGIIAAIWL